MSERSKIDLTAPLFCAKREAKEDTVFDVIRKTISTHGNAMSYEDLKTFLEANWKPEKAETYGPGYIRAYVTGGLKEGYITQDINQRVEYSFRPKGGAKAVEKAKAEKKPTPAPVAETRTAPVKKATTRNDMLQFLRDTGGFDTFEDSSSARITIDEISSGMNVIGSTIKGIVMGCTEDGLTTVDDKGFIFLTKLGFSKTRESLTA